MCPKIWCDMESWKILGFLGTKALFSSQNFRILGIGIVALSFVFDKYCPIID